MKICRAVALLYEEIKLLIRSNAFSTLLFYCLRAIENNGKIRKQIEISEISIARPRPPFIKGGLEFPKLTERVGFENFCRKGAEI